MNVLEIAVKSAREIAVKAVRDTSEILSRELAARVKTKLEGKQDKLSATGASNRGVYVSATGTVSAMEHTLEKDVPADAVFTDTVTEVDATLSNDGQAADAKASGDAIAALQKENALLRELLGGIDAPVYRTAGPGNPVAFSDGAAANLKALSVEITPTQAGSGDPSPDNVRPISGVTSVNVVRRGKNLVDAADVSDVGAQRTVATFTIPAGAYVLSAVVSNSGTANGNVKLTDSLNNAYCYLSAPSGTTASRVNAGFHLDEETALTLVISGSTGYRISAADIQIEAGTSATAYEPYQGQTVAVSMGEAGTVYGGTLNVTTGELTVTQAAVNASSLAWTRMESRDFWYSANFVKNTGASVLTGVTAYEQGPAYPNDNAVANGKKFGITLNPNGSLYCTNYLSNAPEGLIVYRLETPVAYRLAPAQLAAVSGYNNVSVNAETVTVEYQSNYNNAGVITLTDIAAASPVPEQHRMVFGGRNLGESVSAAQIAAVRDGSFSGLLVGDYWIINGVTWRIVDMDYWYACGSPNFRTHHLVVMPDTSLITAKMNETNATEGGYTGSKMYADTLPTVKTTCEAAFPSMILTHKDYLVSAVTDGKPSGGGWMDSSVELPSEIMMYGSRIIAPGNDGATVSNLYTINKQQLALFHLAPRFIKASTWFLLRDPISAAHFAAVSTDGDADRLGASIDSGVRPVFPVG